MPERAELEVIYREAPVGLALLDKDMRFLKVNEALAEINGIAAAEHIGRTVAAIVPNVAAGVERIFRSVLESGIPIRDLEVSGETPKAPGERRTWVENISPVRVGGVITGILVSVLEITERKRMEERLNEAVARERLLLHELSHRMGNSMQLIASVLSLQARAAKDAAARGAFESAQNRIRALGLVHQRLYQPGSEIGAQDPAVFIQGLCGDIAAAFTTSGGDLRVQVDAEAGIRLPHNDTVALGMIVSELVTNACKHARLPNERCTVQVRLERQGTQARVMVGNDGAALPHDFGFAKSDGLGMKIVEAQVRQLRGRMEVDRAPPGARFFVTFPLSSGAQPTDEGAVAPPEMKQAAGGAHLH